MARDDLLRRYLDAGMQFTQMTQKRAEAIVRDLVKTGEVQTNQAQAAVQDLLDRSRKNTERLVDQIRSEVRAQVNNLGLATRADLERLERKIDKVAKASKSAANKPAARKTAAKKTAAAKKKAAAAKSG